MKQRHGVAIFWRHNGLSITLLALFLSMLCGQLLTGWRQHNAELAEHGAAPLALGDYASSGAFLEVTAENRESEFLQMFAYVVFTIFLFQRGSSESNPVAAAHAETGSE